MSVRHFVLSVAIMLFALPSAAERLYVHMTVVDDGGDTTVEMTLPLGFVQRAAELLSDADVHGSCHLRIDHHEFELEEMHRVADALRGGEQGVIAVSHRDELRFRRVGDEIEIVADDGWDEAVTRMPAELFFTAFPQRDRVDFSAALEILASRGGGELLVSTADDGRVRVWVDRNKAIGGGAR